ncbi:MAG: DNA polymerase I [Deltaproteobacteria bacterium]|nr:MAG: DNA polymerase I [Deltaproteobacteria bacterium]
MERLHILDAHGYVFRAYYGLAGQRVRLATAGGMPTGALYVYASMLLRLYLDEHPDRIAVVFDAPGKSFRADIDDQYKANRPELPDDLRQQMPYFQPLTEAFGWPVLSVPDVEADDVIATLVRRAVDAGLAVTIYSADKDLMQLVSDRVTVVDAMRQVVYDRDRVRDKFGVPPEQLADWLALVGDSSDNIPGMPLVGKKTATALLRDYGDIDGILAHTGDLKGKLRANFEDPVLVDRLRRSRELVALRDDVPLDVDLDALRRGPWDGTRLKALFEQLEFRGLVDRLGATGGAAADAERIEPSETARQPPVVVADAGEAAAWFRAARDAGRLAVVVEVDAQRPVRADVVGIGLAVPGRPPAYFPIGHRYLSAPPQLSRDAFVAIARDVLEDPAVAKVCHDAKNARTYLSRLGIALDGVTTDAMLAAYLLDASSDAYPLHEVVRDYAGADIPARVDLTGKGKAARGFDAVAIDRAAEYAGGAAAALLPAADALRERLRAADLERLHDELELPLARVLSDMERAGVRVDVACLRALGDRLSAHIAALERRVHELAGEPFNLGSPKQVAAVLFDRLGLDSPRMRKTKTGYSTDHEVLEAMRDLHPIVAPILEHRELVKLKGTYIDALPPLVNPDTGRVHTQFRQAVAATGRLSSSDPNLQNIPIRTELGREIRRAFVAEPGRKLLSCDYSQIELRLLAHYCEDPVLVSAFRDGVDIHTRTAAEVFGLAPDAVGPVERRVAKAVNYGLIYGQSAFGLSRALDIPREVAEDYIQRYFARFTRVQAFLDDIVASARRLGYSTTILGRRRPIPNLGSRNVRLRRAAERVARNTPLQGSGADILKLAMLRADQILRDERLPARLVLTVHDELVFEVDAGAAADVAERVRRAMETVYELRVPLVVDVGIADNWADAH